MAEPQSTLVPSKTGSPGERILKIQADLLRKEKFLEVLDAETVNSWQVNWAVLEDLETPPKPSELCNKAHYQKHMNQ